MVAAVISMGTFGVIAGALAANASEENSAKVTTDQPTTTEGGTVTEQSSWGARPGVPPSGGVPQQGPSTQSNGS